MMRWGMVYAVLLLGLAALGAAANGDYKLAPQDKITVTVLKHAELSGSYTIPPDGAIDVPRAGRLMVVGKTTAEVAATLRELLVVFLKEPEVVVTLSEVRTRSAYALGAVAKPGQYLVTAHTRVTELLAAAGDLVGDRAELIAKVIRGGETIPIDLPAALAGTKPEANLLIREGDLLWVETPAKLTVVVNGQVKTPGAVKLRQGSTLVDALAAAGDVMDRPEKMRITLLRKGTVTSLQWGDTKRTMEDGDVLLVEKEPVARVFINGQVKTPGMYDLPEGGGVLEAITLAGGMLPDAALDQVTLKHTDGSQVKVDLVDTLRLGTVKNNPKLAAGDTVIVPVITARIAVLGHVAKPGPILIQPGEPLTVIDALSQAGGGIQKAKLSEVSVIRKVNGKDERIVVDVNAILKKGKYENNFVLQAKDVVYVPGSTSIGLSDILQMAGLAVAAL